MGTGPSNCAEDQLSRGPEWGTEQRMAERGVLLRRVLQSRGTTEQGYYRAGVLLSGSTAEWGTT